MSNPHRISHLTFQVTLNHITVPRLDMIARSIAGLLLEILKPCPRSSVKRLEVTSEPMPLHNVRRIGNASADRNPVLNSVRELVGVGRKTSKIHQTASYDYDRQQRQKPCAFLAHTIRTTPILYMEKIPCLLDNSRVNMESNLSSQHCRQDSCTDGGGQPSKAAGSGWQIRF